MNFSNNLTIKERIDEIIKGIMLMGSYFESETAILPPKNALDITTAEQQLLNLIQGEKIKEIEFARNAWHGTTDKEFANIMNDRLQALKQGEKK